MEAKLYFTLFLTLIVTQVNSSIPPKISPLLLERLENGEKVNVFISFVGGIDSTLRSFSTRTSGQFHYDDPQERTKNLEFLRDSLIDNMEVSQRDINHLLSKRSNSSSSSYGIFKNFWITNQIFIENADFIIIQEILKDPKVSGVREEGRIHLFEPDSVRRAEKVDIPWGIRKIQAPEAWSTSNGEGVIVATIDTGVRHTHEALAPNFLGDHGWYDPSGSQDTPFDIIGHGTHVTATILGQNGIGVAPLAKWASCAICSNNLTCLPRFTLECGQFFICPTLPNGSSPNCSKTPHIISNAWGTEMVEEWTSLLKVWRSAGIIPVFALGNSGPSCSSSYFPGNSSAVIGVGNTNFEDALNLTSSVGPTSDGRIKPDIVAPGTDILSAGVTDDRSYHIATGTSMSAPHVAGAIALLLGKQRNLTFEQVKTLLFESADRKGLGFDAGACALSSEGPMEFPNNLFGHGRLNVFNALKMI